MPLGNCQWGSCIYGHHCHRSTLFMSVPLFRMWVSGEQGLWSLCFYEDLSSWLLPGTQLSFIKEWVVVISLLPILAVSKHINHLIKVKKQSRGYKSTLNKIKHRALLSDLFSHPVPGFSGLWFHWSFKQVQNSSYSVNSSFSSLKFTWHVCVKNSIIRIEWICMLHVHNYHRA